MKAGRKVVVIDDDNSVRQSIGRLVRSAGYQAELHDSAKKFLTTSPSADAGCLIVDVHMPEITGLELQEELNRRKVHTPIIFITGQGDVPMSVKAMKGGATNFLPKPFDEDELLSIIESATEKEAEIQAVRQRLEALTPREHEVLELVITGLLNKQIAYELGIAEKTVKVHRGRMMRKMKVRSVAQLVPLVEKAGLYAKEL